MSSEARELLAQWAEANESPEAQKRLTGDVWRLWRLARDLASALEGLLSDRGAE